MHFHSTDRFPTFPHRNPTEKNSILFDSEEWTGFVDNKYVWPLLFWTCRLSMDEFRNTISKVACTVWLKIHLVDDEWDFLLASTKDEYFCRFSPRRLNDNANLLQAHVFFYGKLFGQLSNLNSELTFTFDYHESRSVLIPPKLILAGYNWWYDVGLSHIYPIALESL